MTATKTSKPAKDGTSAAFTLEMAAESVSGNTANATYLAEPVGETLISPATAGNQNATAAGVSAANAQGVQGVTGGVPLPISAAALPLPAGASTAAGLTAINATLGSPSQDGTLTGGTAKTIARGGQKGTTNTNADITHTSSGANHEAFDVAVYDASGNQLGLVGSPLRTDPTGTTPQPVTLAGGATAANQASQLTQETASATALGAPADAAWVSGSGSAISLLKKIAAAGGSAVSVADGSNVAEGTTTDAAWSGTGSSTVVAALKAIYAKEALAATAALQPTNAAQGSTTAGQTGPLSMMAVVNTSPTWTGGQTQPLNCDLIGALRVNVGASQLPSPPNLATGQVSIGTTATLIVAQRNGRYAVTIINKGSTEVDIGGASVTTATGSPLPAVLWASKTILTTAAIYGIVASGTQTIAFEELF